MNSRAGLRRALLFVFLCPVFASSQDVKTTGSVAPGLVEFRIPLEQPADPIWSWNREETEDNACEYMWQVAVPNGNGRYSFGLYLYKSPGSKPQSGKLQDLFKAGQASVFREDSQGHGDLVEDSSVTVSEEDGRIVLRISDPGLIQTIFSNHPKTATINTRAIGSKFEIVEIQYSR